MVDNQNPVPKGVAGSGGAFILGEGLGGLRYLQRTDYLQAQQRARAQAAARKQADTETKDILSRAKFTGETGVHYLPALDAEQQALYPALTKLATDTSRPWAERSLAVQQQVDALNRKREASKKVDDFLGRTIQRVVADKRYNTAATTSKLTDQLYERDAAGNLALNATGQPRTIDPLQLDTQHIDDAVGTGNEHLNGVEVFKQYLRGGHPDAVTSAREALPGGRGYRNVASSDVYELTQEGKIKYDPATNLPVVKATPQSLAYFDSDPVSRQYLDGFEQQHQKQLAGAVAKMQNLEQLTPDEAEAVRVEQSPEGRRMELFKKGLMEQGYGRQSQAVLQRAAPRPRVGRSTANQSVTMVGNDYLPGAVIGGEHGDTSGVTSFGVLPALTYGKPGTQPKNFVGKNVKHQEVVTMANDGSPVVTTQSNQAAGDVSYGQRHIFLRSTKTGNVFLGSHAAVEAAKRGDFAASDAEARKFRAAHPEYHPELYVEANPVGASGVQAGSKEEYYKQLQTQQQVSQQAFTDAGGIGNPPHLYSENELRDKANKEYAHISKTHYVRYRGADKLTIDGATQYALKSPKALQVMQKALADADHRTSPGTKEEQEISRGRGPLAGALAPTKPPATSKPNPYGFRFKK